MICSSVTQVCKPVRRFESGVLGRGLVNCRQARCSAASPLTRSAGSSSSGATTALSITASAAVSALLAKITALIASGAAPGMLLAALHPSSTIFKPTEKIYESASGFQTALADKIAVAHAPAPAVRTASIHLPSDWLVVSSAAEWFDQNRQAAAAGALLATVFVSDKAALAHAPLLERLRRNFGTGVYAPVRFVFVHIADGYAERHSAASSGTASAASPARGPQGLTLGRVSHTAAVHGLDVALSSFLPDGIRAFPSLLLTAGPAADGDVSGAHWAAATRVEEMTQLVSDWAFINRRAAAAVKTPAVAGVDAEAAANAAHSSAAAAVPVGGPARRGPSSTEANGAVRVGGGHPKATTVASPAVKAKQPRKQQREGVALVGV